MSENSSFLKVIRKVFGSRSNTSIYFEPCGSHETNPFPWPVSYILNPRGSHKTNPFGPPGLYLTRTKQCEYCGGHNDGKNTTCQGCGAP